MFVEKIDSNNIWDLFFGIFKVLTSWSVTLYDLLFTPIEVGFTIPFIHFTVGFTFTPFWDLALPIVVTVFVFYIVKQFLPLA